MELVFKHIDEKDIDMLVMNRVSEGGAVLDLIKQVVADEMAGNPQSYELVKVHHSASTRNGESDLLLLLSGS